MKESKRRLRSLMLLKLLLKPMLKKPLLKMKSLQKLNKLLKLEFKNPPMCKSQNGNYE
jgi:hypothetical protein